MEKLVNFRDMGGIRNKYGKLVRPKRLLRSGELFALSDNDKESLKTEYDLKMVFDFRDDGEVACSPDVILEGVVYAHIDIMKDVDLGGASKQNLFKMVDLGEADAQMEDLYRKMALCESARRGYRQFIKAVAGRTQGSVLFHCFAGKDRTGVGAMLLLRLLEVDEALIIEDYLKTNEQRKEENAALIGNVRNSGLSEDKIQVLHTFLSVKEAYLKAADQAIEEEYGSFAAYVKNGLGIGEELVGRLKENYLD